MDNIPEIDATEKVENANEAEMIHSEIESMSEQALTEIMNDKLDTIVQLLNQKIMRSSYDEKILDQMHSELQKYKEGMYAQLISPVLSDIIEVRDSIIRVAASYMMKAEGEQDIPNKTFSGYAYDLQDILEKNNVEIYRSEPGTPFVPAKQRAIKKEITDEEALHGKIAASHSCGYIYNGRVLSAEKVSLYYYEPVKTKVE